MAEGAPAHDYSNIASRWKELSGLNNWDGLLNPLDLDLRRYVLHYTDMGLAIGDALINNDASPYFGRCRYTKESLLRSVGLINGRNGITQYDVTKLVYVNSSDLFGKKQGTYFGGYVAVASDAAKKVLGRRDILVAWRGTVTLTEILEDLNLGLVADDKLFPADQASNNVQPKVHTGFHDLYTMVLPENENELGKVSARDQVLSEVERLVEQYKGEEVSITIVGHSMGSALGTLNALDIVTNGYNEPKGYDTAIPVTAIVSGTPRVGDGKFKDYLEAKPDLHILRVVNDGDIVKELPPWLIFVSEYEHVGVELRVDSTKSPYLVSDASKHYDQVYLHAVAGWHKDSPFKLAVARDLTLVNKAANALKDEYKKAGSRTPEQWWVVTNKGMVQQDDGNWILDPDVPIQDS